MRTRLAWWVKSVAIGCHPDGVWVPIRPIRLVCVPTWLESVREQVAVQVFIETICKWGSAMLDCSSREVTVKYMYIEGELDRSVISWDSLLSSFHLNIFSSDLGSVSPPMYSIPSRWRLIILQQGVWEVAPVSELSVDAVLIKLHTAGKGPPPDMAPLTLHSRTTRKTHQLSWYWETLTAFFGKNITFWFTNNNPRPFQRSSQRQSTRWKYFTSLLYFSQCILC